MRVFLAILDSSPIDTWTRTIGDNCYNIHDREVPLVLLFVPNGTHLSVVIESYGLFHAHMSHRPLRCKGSEFLREMQIKIAFRAIFIVEGVKCGV